LESEEAEQRIIELASSCDFRFQYVKTNFSNPKLRAYFTNLGENNCNCGSVIGKKEWAEDAKFDIEKERIKLERKRFSKNRIAQLLVQKQQEIELKRANGLKSETEEAEKWIKFFENLKKGKLSHRVGLIFHQFSSKISDELVQIEEELFLPKIDLEALKHMKQNRLYWLKMLRKLGSIMYFPPTRFLFSGML
jgi:hypothetical protein